MFRTRGFVLILYFFIIRRVDAFDLNDCSYDAKNEHVSYLCGVENGANFALRTRELLYCKNFLSGINRSELFSLSLPGCRGETIDKNFIMTTFQSLQMLNISNAGLSYLSDDVFKYNKHLEKLLFAHNLFGSKGISGNLFKSVPNLRELDLSHNAITQLDSDTFSYTPKLTAIDLSSNSISNVNASVFPNALKVLNLANNFIRNIESNLFINNKNMKQLDVTDNQIIKLDCELLKTFADSDLMEIKN